MKLLLVICILCCDIVFTHARPKSGNKAELENVFTKEPGLDVTDMEKGPTPKPESSQVLTEPMNEQPGFHEISKITKGKDLQNKSNSESNIILSSLSEQYSNTSPSTNDINSETFRLGMMDPSNVIADTNILASMQNRINPNVIASFNMDVLCAFCAEHSTFNCFEDLQCLG